MADPASGLTGDKLRLDYVSPLPPVRSGIADYSLDLLPRLDRLCDLRVIGLPGQAVEAAVADRWRPAPAAACGEESRLPLYQMGNNSHHAGVLELALERPGVLTLHDLVLHHLLVEVTLGRGVANLGDYQRRLAADHGWIGEWTGRARRWCDLGQAGLFTLAAQRTLLGRQRGVLVHSRWAADRLLEDDRRLSVGIVPMGVPLPPLPDPAAGHAFRERLGLAAETPLIGSFGFQTPIKRTEKVVQALARPELAEFHLVIAGEVSPALALDSEAAAAGVADRMHVTGFLDYADFEAAISACDVCVNLRYPTAGETSASLLRVLALGRPTLVSDYAQFRELPDGVVAKIALGENEVALMARELARLLGMPDRLREMAARAREHVRREHDPARTAAAVVEHCRAFAGREPAGDAAPQLAPPSTLLWHRVAGELEVAGVESPWPEGARRRLSIRLSNGGEARWLATRRGQGGVMVELSWRRAMDQASDVTRWLSLPRDLEPGESVNLTLEMRRPLGGRWLVVEPHVAGLAGFNALGGPSWVSEI